MTLKSQGIKSKRLILSVVVLTAVMITSGLSQEPHLLPDFLQNPNEARISPVLAREVLMLRAKPVYDYAMPVIVQFEAGFYAEFTRGNSVAKDALGIINGYRTRLTAAQITRLIEKREVRYLTLDMPIRSLAGKGDKGGGSSSTLENVQLKSVGADLVHSEGILGEGVTVAVFDSGVRDHADIKGMQTAVDFTSGVAVEYNVKQSSGLDEFGHGTHVAGIIAGNGSKSSGEFSGMAQKVSLVDIKVVGSDGMGQTSNLIAAIDWLINNNDKLGVQIANLSIGHPPIESYATDPLCQAVSRMVETGIVTVASAGNKGKDATRPEIWGAINSPGNDPSVITVGAVNDRGTAAHFDDIATSYSSRGPTYVDGLFKPDLVAPGNHIGSTLAKFSYLYNDYPDLQINDDYIYLSGTSMSTAYVSGALALMLEANPQLTPRLAKAILLLTSIRLSEPHILEQGNGLLNVYTAVKVAQAIDVESQTLIAEVTPYWYLDGQEVWAGGAFAAGDRVIYSPLVDGSFQGAFWGDGLFWVDGLIWSEGMVWIDSVFQTGSELWDGPDTAISSDGVLWTDASFWSDALLWLDAVFWTDTVLSTSAVFWTDGVFWTDSEIFGDSAGGHDFRGDPSN